MKKQYGVALFSAGLLALTGCGFESTETGPFDTQSSDHETTGLSLTVDIIGDTDVAGFRFILETCAGVPVATNDRELEDMTLPGGIPNFLGTDFLEGTQHLFSDNFVVLPPGCYNVVAQPITATGAASQDCEPTSANNLIVKPKKTTEVLLVSQCPGPQVGALDVIAALDHKPRLENLVYEKFVCVGEAVNICASASDPNLNQLSFAWTQLTGPRGLIQSLEVDSSDFDPATGIWTECINVTPPAVGTYSMQVRASTPTLAEDYDRAVLAFPIHAAECDPIGGGPEEPEKPKKKKKKRHDKDDDEPIGGGPDDKNDEPIGGGPDDKDGYYGDKGEPVGGGPDDKDDEPVGGGPDDDDDDKKKKRRGYRR